MAHRSGRREKAASVNAKQGQSIGGRNRPVLDGAPVTPRGQGGMFHYKEKA